VKVRRLQFREPGLERFLSCCILQATLVERRFSTAFRPDLLGWSRPSARRHSPLRGVSSLMSYRVQDTATLNLV